MNVYKNFSIGAFGAIDWKSGPSNDSVFGSKAGLAGRYG